MATFDSYVNSMNSEIDFLPDIFKEFSQAINENFRGQLEARVETFLVSKPQALTWFKNLTGLDIPSGYLFVDDLVIEAEKLNKIATLLRLYYTPGKYPLLFEKKISYKFDKKHNPQKVTNEARLIELTKTTLEETKPLVSGLLKESKFKLF